jgi:hypothetical protein
VEKPTVGDTKIEISSRRKTRRGSGKGEVGVVRRREKRIKNGDENVDVRE